MRAVPLLLWAASASFGQPDITPLRREPLEKYDAYIRQTEARIEREVHSPTFLWSSQSPARLERVRAGAVVTEPGNGRGDVHLGGADIHDWIGAFFLRGAKIGQVTSFLSDFGVHKNYFFPEVTDSRLLSRTGNESLIYYRIVKKKWLTVVYNTNQTAYTYSVSPTRGYSRSFASRIAEVKDAGKPTEHELPIGKDHGFLWRLNTYWRYEEKDGGVYVECETVSLTRDVPFGWGWLVYPLIRNLPRESLAHILESTREGVRARQNY